MAKSIFTNNKKKNLKNLKSINKGIKSQKALKQNMATSVSVVFMSNVNTAGKPLSFYVRDIDDKLGACPHVDVTENIIFQYFKDRPLSIKSDEFFEKYICFQFNINLGIARARLTELLDSFKNAGYIFNAFFTDFPQEYQYEYHVYNSFDVGYYTSFEGILVFRKFTDIISYTDAIAGTLNEEQDEMFKIMLDDTSESVFKTHNSCWRDLNSDAFFRYVIDHLETEEMYETDEEEEDDYPELPPVNNEPQTPAYSILPSYHEMPPPYILV